MIYFKVSKHLMKRVHENKLVPAFLVLSIRQQWLAMILELSRMIYEINLILKVFGQKPHYI